MMKLDTCVRVGKPEREREGFPTLEKEAEVKRPDQPRKWGRFSSHLHPDPKMQGLEL